MINVNMTDKAGVTLATAGKYCADNVKVTPSADILRKDEQAKTATPTTSTQDITPDAGKALSKVTVNPITAAIVGGLDAEGFASAIVAAIEGKGVDVPSGAKLSALAALIESIEAGGGGAVLINGKRCLFGTATTSNGGSTITVLTHQETLDLLGGSLFSNYVCAWWSSALEKTGSGGAVYGIGAKNAYGTPHYMHGTTLTAGSMLTIGSMYAGGTYIQTASMYSNFLAGQEYNWIFIEV